MTSGRDFHGGEGQIRPPNIDWAAVHPGPPLRIVRFVEIRVAGNRCVDVRDDPSVGTILVDDVDCSIQGAAAGTDQPFATAAVGDIGRIQISWIAGANGALRSRRAAPR